VPSHFETIESCYTIVVKRLSPEAQRLLTTFDLHESGVELMRQKLRRENPTLDEAGIAQLLQAWLNERPGAPYGDGAGVPTVWPRSAP